MTGASSVWISQPPSIGLRTVFLGSGANLSFGELIVRILRFFFCIRTSLVPSSYAGAINTSRKRGVRASANSIVTGSFTQMIEPKALSGSLAKAASYASNCVLPNAAPHGLLCFTITQA